MAGTSKPHEQRMDALLSRSPGVAKELAEYYRAELQEQQALLVDAAPEIFQRQQGRCRELKRMLDFVTKTRA